MATALATQPTSESKVWLRAVGGDTNAFEQIVVSHQSAVSAVAFSIVGDFSISQDIAQETFWAAWKSRNSLGDPKRLRAWLCGIARNLARQWRRKKSRVQEIDNEKFGGQFDSFATDPADDFVSKEEESVVWSALEQIPSNYREVLVLYYRQGNSIEEVAKSLGLTNAAARQRLARGREILRTRVSTMIEGVLDRTNPSRTFTARVMAGIATMSVVGSSSVAKASGMSMALNSSTATSAASVAKLLASGSLTGSVIGVAGGLLGAAGGLVGAWFGSWLPAQMAPTETERHLLMERFLHAIPISIIFVIITIVTSILMATVPNLWFTNLMIMLISTAWFTVAIMVHGLQTQRLVRKLRAELTAEEDPNQSKFGTKIRSKTEGMPQLFGRKYTSPLKLLGFPLVDIQISDPPRMDVTHNKSQKSKACSAKGWIAIGDVATGFVAIGGRTLGVLSLGGMSVGVFAIGGLSIGLCSIGGLALGWLALGGGAIGYDAVGGGAIGWHSAVGGGAIAWHVATGGGAIAQDFAVGGGAIANEVNTDLAQQVVDNESFAWMIEQNFLIQQNFLMIGAMIFSVAIPAMLTPFLYTRTPPES